MIFILWSLEWKKEKFPPALILRARSSEEGKKLMMRTVPLPAEETGQVLCGVVLAKEMCSLSPQTEARSALSSLQLTHTNTESSRYLQVPGLALVNTAELQPCLSPHLVDKEPSILSGWGWSLGQCHTFAHGTSASISCQFILLSLNA